MSLPNLGVTEAATHPNGDLSVEHRHALPDPSSRGGRRGLVLRPSDNRVLLITASVLARLSIPLDPLDRGEWLKSDVTRVKIALNLVPFAGIAFLWFMGAFRARLADLENRFFATVFLGSGLLFLGLLFTGAAVIGAIILVNIGEREPLVSAGSFAVARALSYAPPGDEAVKPLASP
jgi:hypothetical protein